jgi:hypothetical protein
VCCRSGEVSLGVRGERDRPLILGSREKLQHGKHDFQDDNNAIGLKLALLGGPYRLRHPDAAASRTPCDGIDCHEPGLENLPDTTRAVPGQDVRRPEWGRDGPMNASPDSFELTLVKPLTSARSAFVDFHGAQSLDLQGSLTIGALHRGRASGFRFIDRLVPGAARSRR